MESFDRTERLLALVLLNQLKGATQREKALQLNIAGFTNVEIADLLQTSGTGVSDMLYKARKNSVKERVSKTKKASKNKR